MDSLLRMRTDAFLIPLSHSLAVLSTLQTARRTTVPEIVANTKLPQVQVNKCLQALALAKHVSKTQQQGVSGTVVKYFIGHPLCASD